MGVRWGGGEGRNSMANGKWEDGRSQILKVEGTGKNEIRFPSDEKFGLNFWKLLMPNGRVYCGISKKEATLRGIHIFFANALRGIAGSLLVNSTSCSLLETFSANFLTICPHFKISI